LQGRWEEATSHYMAALRANPGNPDVHFNMGIALMNLGDMTNAVGHIGVTVRHLPSHPLAHRYLGDALAGAGRVQEAIAQYRKALNINSNQPEVLNSLAWLLATHPDAGVRNGKEAVQFAERACQLTEFKSSLLLGTLAAAYAEAGQFEHAVQAARQAGNVATEQSNRQLAAKHHAMQEQYERHQPYRE
jgi:Flp pilus assembly protein TadD